MSHKISFREIGHGKPLVLVHGYGGSVLHWDPIVKVLSQTHRVIVPNFSHLYMSQDRLLFTIQIEKFADFLREKFPRQRVGLVGTSYGGALCWGLSLRYPELVEDLILINPMVTHPVSHFVPTELKYFFKFPLKAKYIYMLLMTSMGKSFLLKIAELFRAERLDGAGKIDHLQGRKLQFISGIIAHFSWILRNEDWFYWDEKLHEITIRSLLIYDTHDPLFDAKTYIEFGEKISVDHIHKTTGQGHLSIKYAFDEISKVIQQFLLRKSQTKVG